MKHPVTDEVVTSVIETAGTCGIEANAKIPTTDTGNFHFYNVKENKAKVVHAKKGETQPTEIVVSTSPRKIIETMNAIKMGCELGVLNTGLRKRCERSGGKMIDDKCQLPDHRLSTIARMDLSFKGNAISSPEWTWEMLSQANAFVPLKTGVREQSFSMEVDRDTAERWFAMADEKPVVNLQIGESVIKRWLVDSLVMETIVGKPIDQDKNLVVTLYRSGSGINGAEIVKPVDIEVDIDAIYVDYIRKKIRPDAAVEIDAARNFVKKGREFLDLIKGTKNEETRQTITENFGFGYPKPVDEAIEFVEKKVEEKTDFLLEKGVLDVN